MGSGKITTTIVYQRFNLKWRCTGKFSMCLMYNQIGWLISEKLNYFLSFCSIGDVKWNRQLNWVEKNTVKKKKSRENKGFIHNQTYGLRNIILNVASEPRCSNVPSASRTCSLAAITSSDCGWPPEPSSSTLNRYRKHLSLNGCSLFTVMQNKIVSINSKWNWHI